jgi:polysaccharide export outer membrane protein
MRAVLAALLALALAGCGANPLGGLFGRSGGTSANAAGPAGTAPRAGEVPHDLSEYRLGPGDQVQVNVYGQPDLTGKLEVSGDGMVAMPLIGPMQAKDLTVVELARTIAAVLDRNYLVDPKVSVEVQKYRPFSVLGQVSNPGRFPYAARLDVREAVAMAGGFTRRARTNSMAIYRHTALGQIEIEATPDTPVLPGDTVEIWRRLF